MKIFLDVMYDDTKNARKIKSCDYNHEGKYPIIDQSSKNVIGYTDEIDGLYNDVPVIIFGDHTRRFKLVEEPFFIGADGTKVLKLRSSVYDYKFIYYYLLHKKIPDTGYNRHFKWVKELEFPEIPRSIQSDIVKKREVLNDLISSKNKLLESFDILIKSRFVELIYNNKLIYQKVRLKDCCLISSGATPSRKNSDYWDENGINWFKTTELKNNFLFDSDEKISKLGYEKTSVKILPKHTVLIAMYGQGKTRGMTGYLLNNATTNQACAALISLDTINPKYLWYTMINSYDRLRNMAKGGTQPNLSVSLIKDFEIILPPIDIQNKFTNYIEQINKLKSDVQKSIEETQLLMDSLMQEYFG